MSKYSAQVTAVHTQRVNINGPVNRVISPDEAGHAFKPFVFLDYFNFSAANFKGFKSHPHSGIATLTYMISGRNRYSDTTGKSGVLSDGSVEWMQAGGGVWHANGPVDNGICEGYQLWIALPPELELAAAQSQYVSADKVPVIGSARLLLGSYSGLNSPVNYPAPATLLYIELEAGETYHYDIPVLHDLTWFFISKGSLNAEHTYQAGEVVYLQDHSSIYSLTANEKTQFIIGSSPAHPHELSLGYYSVHTSEEALQEGERNIKKLYREGIKLNQDIKKVK